MKVYSFKIDEKDVEGGLVNGERGWKVDNEEPSKNHSYPFIFISNGDMGIGLKFQSQEDVDHFKREVEGLEYMTPEIYEELCAKHKPRPTGGKG